MGENHLPKKADDFENYWGTLIEIRVVDNDAFIVHSVRENGVKIRKEITDKEKGR